MIVKQSDETGEKSQIAFENVCHTSDDTTNASGQSLEYFSTNN